MQPLRMCTKSLYSLPSVSSSIHDEGTLIEAGFKLEIWADLESRTAEKECKLGQVSQQSLSDGERYLRCKSCWTLTMARKAKEGDFKNGGISFGK